MDNPIIWTDEDYIELSTQYSIDFERHPFQPPVSGPHRYSIVDPEKYRDAKITLPTDSPDTGE